MITNLRVKAFKRFEDEEFLFSPLTILSGRNGSGKTSIIQSLLIAWESSNGGGKSVRLNGPFGLQLGTADDVLNWGQKPPIQVSIETEDGRQSVWEFEASTPEALYLDVLKLPERTPPAFAGVPRAFTYLSAERLGPRNFLAMSSLPDDSIEIGAQGEYCAHLLSVVGSKIPVHINRVYPSVDGGEAVLLKYEIEKWLSEIAKPVEINAEVLSNSSIATLSFKSPGGEAVKAPNMGFGVSYALPIVLGGLVAVEGGILIVENPEAHLHPAGQSKMGAFLAWLAGKGVQVVVETHSDHIINGIRRAIAEFQYLPSTSAVVHFFGSEFSHDECGSVALSISDTGGISHWPSGFFDQYQIDVSSLGRLRRRGK